MVSSQDVEGFVAITGAPKDAAERMLEMCRDLSQAVTLWYSDEDLQRSMLSPPPPAAPATSSTGAAAATSRPNHRNVGREDAQGVIHIDSDDDDVHMTENDDFAGFESDDENDPASVAQAAQEEEDAAMARRLQEEFYGGGASATGASGAANAAGQAEDDVRAPISRRTETLVAGYGDDDEVDDDGHAAFMAHMRRRAQAQAQVRNNPFARSIWDDNNQPSVPSGAPSSRAARLTDLFRPPFDLMHRIPVADARELGKEGTKWVMVNLQDMSIFSCQTLNRDVWKDEAVKALVRENFIFLQYDKTDPLAEQYINYYFVGGGHENQDNYPHVGIIDPRTGEQVKVWSGEPFPSAVDFHMQLVEFLDRYSLAVNSKNPVPKAKKERVVDVDRMTEEEMLEMALQNSLATSNGTSSGSSNIVDPDQLTTAAAPASASSSSKGKQKALTPEPDPEPAPPAQQETAFSRIPSDRPHVEPPVGAAGSTRIQFRHTEGRTIRRFRFEDPVSVIYEWLKAEPPVANKSGVEFELKSMPQRQDLIELLDKTIQEAGLGNATIFLEYLED
ncbi:hypothetical protein QBC38DRAFT_215992 [Podospora fimiseda]|uniref:UBX domain-containing protein n=1 Tax=Podospora fimiseda TaxID=252190 RepID=A0AAN7H3N1_9PEZI|nr:hypothetical protein QBC38DRAFT_215992 [Podospora fimiseda]